MDNIVTITTAHNNELEFDLSIDGLNDADAVVHFIIETSTHELSFPCNRNGVKWDVSIPSMHSLDIATYPFAIQVVVDGYFFKPLTGHVNVISDKVVSATVPTPPVPTLPTPDTDEDEEPIKKKLLDLKDILRSNDEEVGIHIEDTTTAFDEIIDRIVAEKNKTKPTEVKEAVEEPTEAEEITNEIINDTPDEIVEEEVVVVESDEQEEVDDIVEPVNEEIVEENKLANLIDDIKGIDIDYTPNVEISTENLMSDITGKSQRDEAAKVERLIDDIKQIDMKVTETVEDEEPIVDEIEPVVEEVVVAKDDQVEKILEDMKAEKPRAPKKVGKRRGNKILKKKMKTNEKYSVEAEEIAEQILSEKEEKAKKLLGEMKEVTTKKETKPKKKVKFKKS